MQGIYETGMDKVQVIREAWKGVPVLRTEAQSREESKWLDYTPHAVQSNHVEDPRRQSSLSALKV